MAYGWGPLHTRYSLTMHVDCDVAASTEIASISEPNKIIPRNGWFTVKCWSALLSVFSHSKRSKRSLSTLIKGNGRNQCTAEDKKTGLAPVMRDAEPPTSTTIHGRGLRSPEILMGS